MALERPAQSSQADNSGLEQCASRRTLQLIGAKRLATVTVGNAEPVDLIARVADGTSNGFERTSLWPERIGRGLQRCTQRLDSSAEEAEDIARVTPPIGESAERSATGFVRIGQGLERVAWCGEGRGLWAASDRSPSGTTSALSLRRTGWLLRIWPMSHRR